MFPDPQFLSGIVVFLRFKYKCKSGSSYFFLIHSQAFQHRQIPRSRLSVQQLVFPAGQRHRRKTRPHCNLRHEHTANIRTDVASSDIKQIAGLPLPNHLHQLYYRIQIRHIIRTLMKLEHLTLKLDVIQAAQFRQIARLTEIVERSRPFSGNLHRRIDDHNLLPQVLL